MNIVVIILGLFISIFGLLFISVILLDKWDESKVKGWPSVRGTIKTSTVIITKSDCSDEGKGMWTFYEPNIEYKYQVGGKNYVAKDPRFTNITSNARELVAEHPVGKQVDVLYDPKNPKNSRLKAYVEEDWLGTFIVTLIFLALGAASICMAFNPD